MSMLTRHVSRPVSRVNSISGLVAPQAISRSRPLRVAHLHSTLGLYGAERWTLALVKHLNQVKVDSIVISVGTKPGADAFFDLLQTCGLRAFHIRRPGRLNPRAIYELRKLLVEHKIDILHTHGFKSDILGYLATRDLPIRLVATIHGWSADENFRIRAYEAIGRAFLRRFDRVYPLSPDLLRQLLAQGFDPIRVKLVLNSVDLSALDYAFRPRSKSDTFSLLFVGRLCRPKGVFDLVRAFGQATFPGMANLVIVGDGPDKRELEALICTLQVADRVTLVGAVPSVAPYLRNSHGLVLPSYSEGIPRAIMEAFAAGVPVIGTDIPGIRQLVMHESTGLLVPVGDHLSLTRCLESLCEQPEHAEKMAANARQLVMHDFSADRMAADFEHEYRQIVDRA